MIYNTQKYNHTLIETVFCFDCWNKLTSWGSNTRVCKECIKKTCWNCEIFFGEADYDKTTILEKYNNNYYCKECLYYEKLYNNFHLKCKNNDKYKDICIITL